MIFVVAALLFVAGMLLSWVHDAIMPRPKRRTRRKRR